MRYVLKSRQFDVAGRTVTIRFPPKLEEVVDHALSGADYPHFPFLKNPVHTIADVGANVGAAALTYANRHPEARVLCFEPAGEAFELLQENTARVPRIECYPWALSDQSGTMPLYYGADHWAQNSLWRSGMTAAESEDVPVHSASEALISLGASDLSILKVDGEGCEVRVIRNLVSAGRFSIRVIQLEYHSEQARREIDRLLTPAWLLTFSNSTKIHRGRVSYIHSGSCPDSVWYEIKETP